MQLGRNMMYLKNHQINEIMRLLKLLLKSFKKSHPLPQIKYWRGTDSRILHDIHKKTSQ